VERCCEESDRRTIAALGDIHDADAEERFQDRQREAARVEESLGASWHGRQFWYVAIRLNIPPAVMAATWSYDEVFEAYLYLRLQYLREGPGGA